MENRCNLTSSIERTSARIQTDSVADAFYVAFNVNAASINCPLQCEVRILRDIGTYNGNVLRIEIGVFISTFEEFDGSFTTAGNYFFKIAEVNPEFNEIVHEIQGGFIYPSYAELRFDKNGGAIGVALGHKGKEVVFYVEGLPALQKTEFLGGFEPYNTPKPYHIELVTWGPNDHISATFSSFLEIGLIP